MARKYDHSDLERKYVQGEMSIRTLCEQNGVKTWSTIHEYARRNGWAEKRAAFQARLKESEIKSVIDKRVDQLAKALDDAIMISGRAVFAFYDSLQGRWETDPESGSRVFIPPQTIGAGDFVKIMEKLMVLNGQVTNREAHLSMEVSAHGLTMEMLHELAAAARTAGADARPSATSPLPRVEGARSVN